MMPIPIIITIPSSNVLNCDAIAGSGDLTTEADLITRKTISAKNIRMKTISGLLEFFTKSE